MNQNNKWTIIIIVIIININDTIILNHLFYRRFELIKELSILIYINLGDMCDVSKKKFLK